MSAAHDNLLAYCTNVHSGPTLVETKANLERHALEVKRRFSPDEPMGVGLWLAAPAAYELVGDELARFRDWLAERGLVPFTFNGFPHGDFHQPVVKHRVYLPTWWDAERLRYTERLFEIQDALLPEGMSGSVSTLPIGWPTQDATSARLDEAAKNLAKAAVTLARLEAKTGRMIQLAIEPEPGCILQRTDDVVRFFKERLDKSGDQRTIRRHIGVCHDVCHAAVMFEPQADVLRRYADEGIAIAKTQVSAAVAMPLDEMDADERKAAVSQLASFREPRYLHQTVHRDAGGRETFYEDLPQAIEALANGQPSGDWRTHFHVPIYLDRFGALRATQSEIIECLRTMARTSTCRHFEVETYAWGVLPEPLKTSTLAEGIAREMAWLREQGRSSSSGAHT